MVLNRAAGGGSWKAHGIHPDRTRRLIDEHIHTSTLAVYAHAVVDHAIAEGAYAHASTDAGTLRRRP